MIRRPGAVADRSFVRPGDLPAGLGLEVADRNVAAWGGDLAVYRSALTAALRAAADPAVVRSGAADPAVVRSGAADPAVVGSGAADPAVVRSAAAVAAWRAGVVELREDALERLPGLPAAVAAAALGIAVELVAPFLAAQAADRFARPSPVPAGTVLHRVGGYAGLGGPWIAPPVDAAPAGPGRFSVSTQDGAEWTVIADAWGARLRPGPAGAGPAARVRAVVTESYFVELRA